MPEETRQTEPKLNNDVVAPTGVEEIDTEATATVETEPGKSSLTVQEMMEQELATPDAEVVKEESAQPELASEGMRTEVEAMSEVKAIDTGSEKLSKTSKILRIVVIVLVGLLILAGGMLTGAWLQSRRSGTTASLGADLAVRGLVGENETLDLTTDLLMKQLENSQTERNNVVTFDQLVDGGGGGMLVNSIALLPNDDKLTLELLKLHNKQENSCFSPLSVRYALEMLQVGAGGETKSQLDAVLGNLQATRYENIPEHLSLANALWVRDDFAGAIKTGYADMLAENWGADVKADSFQTADNINRWIEEKSFGMLKNVLADADVQGLQAALINVLAIDMNWEHEYDPVNTSGQFFNYNYDYEDLDNIRYTTLREYGGNNTYYNLAADATVLAKDLKEYNGTRLQFVAIMPKNDLMEFIQNVSNEQINRLLVSLRRAVGQNDTYNFGFTSYIPKFSMQSGIDDLIADLNNLGVVDAFSEEADFTNMTNVPFTLTKATHKTNFDFSEEGIRAAAVTVAGGFGAGGGGPIPNQSSIVVSISRPFMYLVRDINTGEIWFAGTVYEPNLWADDRAEYGCTSASDYYCW